MKIIFFGSSSYCLPVLESLNKNFNLTAIITASDSSPQSFALSKYVKEFSPNNTQELTGLKDEIIKLNPDIGIVADYGIIIPKEIFTIPRFKTLNIHFSKLPKLRGPSPVQYTLLFGEKSAWISIIIMDEGTDTGDIIWQREYSLINNGTMEQWNNETTGSLYPKLFNIVSLDLPEVLIKFVQNELKPQKQDYSSASNSRHFTRADGYIPLQILAAAVNCKVGKLNFSKEISGFKLSDWKLFKNLPRLPTANCQLPTLIDRACRALSPWPGLWTTVQITDNKQQITKRLKILKAHLGPSTANYQLQTKLILDLVQLEGKKPVSWKQFREGYPDAISEVQPQIY